jgi:hypothetical protein
VKTSLKEVPMSSYIQSGNSIGDKGSQVIVNGPLQWPRCGHADVTNKFKVVLMGYSENIFCPILATIKCFSMMKSEVLHLLSFVTITRVFLM